MIFYSTLNIGKVSINLKKKLFINGEWVDAQNYVTLQSPFSGEVLAQVPEATNEEVEQAIRAADAARMAIAKMPAHQRASILEKFCKLLEAQSDRAARIIAKEAAKPMKWAKGEVARALQTYKLSAEEAKRIHGEAFSLDAAPGGVGRRAYTVRYPLGVIGAITPFNFPLNLVAHKVGPAIASGNTIVLKPATQTPLSAFLIAELFQEAGLPAGVLNVVTGRGSIVGEKIVKDPRIHMITFTGSPEVGIGIRNKAGLKRVTLELGSNSAVIVDKGVDLDKVVPRCVSGAFAYQGQVCISLQRVYVQDEIFNEFVNKFVQATEELNIGDPLDDNTDISALISSKDVDRALSWIEEAKRGGARIVSGGKANGSILQPTVILDADSSLKVSCNEVFAPIVIINRVKSVSEAIEYVNDSRYGLQAGIYTENVHTAMMAAEELQVGGVMINDIPTFRVDQMPYGGVKESGIGREGVKYAVEEMTEMKLVVFNRN